MTKHKWLITTGATAAAFVAGVAGFQEGVKAWDNWRLPRPVMTPEIWRIADQQQQTILDVLILQKAAAEDQLTKVQLIKSDYDLQQKTVPDYITDEIQKKEQEIDDYNDQILLIKRQAE